MIKQTIKELNENEVRILSLKTGCKITIERYPNNKEKAIFHIEWENNVGNITKTKDFSLVLC